MYELNPVHRKLKILTIEKGLSQAKLAEILSERLGRKIHRSTINHIFRGSLVLPEVRKELCRILGVDPQEIWHDQYQQL